MRGSSVHFVHRQSSCDEITSLVVLLVPLLPKDDKAEDKKEGHLWVVAVAVAVAELL